MLSKSFRLNGHTSGLELALSQLLCKTLSISHGRFNIETQSLSSEALLEYKKLRQTTWHWNSHIRQMKWLQKTQRWVETTTAKTARANTGAKYWQGHDLLLHTCETKGSEIQTMRDISTPPTKKALLPTETFPNETFLWCCSLTNLFAMTKTAKEALRMIVKWLYNNVFNWVMRGSCIRSYCSLLLS